MKFFNAVVLALAQAQSFEEKGLTLQKKVDNVMSKCYTFMEKSMTCQPPNTKLGKYQFRISKVKNLPNFRTETEILSKNTQLILIIACKRRCLALQRGQVWSTKQRLRLQKATTGRSRRRIRLYHGWNWWKWVLWKGLRIPKHATQVPEQIRGRLPEIIQGSLQCRRTRRLPEARRLGKSIWRDPCWSYCHEKGLREWKGLRPGTLLIHFVYKMFIAKCFWIKQK